MDDWRTDAKKGLLDCGCDFVMETKLKPDQQAAKAQAILSPDCTLQHTQGEAHAYLLKQIQEAAQKHAGTTGVISSGDGAVSISLTNSDDQMALGIEAFDYDLTDGDCPICMNWIPTNSERGEHSGALSRFDDSTEICSACGTAETMLDLQLGDFKDAELSDGIYGDWAFWKTGVLLQRDLLVVKTE